MTEPIKRMYRVAWKNGQPGIEIGEMVYCGKTKRGRRVKPRNRVKLEPTGEWSETISGALNHDLEVLVVYYRRHGTSEHPLSKLETVCCKLRRLRVKLERRGLIPVEG